MDLRKDRLIELLLLHSFQVREDPPFQLASGKMSPYYIDCKPVTMHPEGMTIIGALVYEASRRLGVTAVGGLTMGADPIATAAAMHSHLRSRPLQAFSVRKAAKDHGTEQWIEGGVAPGSHVVIVDDVLTTGASTIQAIDRAREAGLVVEHVVVLVDREEGGREQVEKHGVEVHALVTRTELLSRRQAALAHALETV